MCVAENFPYKFEAKIGSGEKSAIMARIDLSGFVLSLQICFLLLIHCLIALPGFMISSNFYIPPEILTTREQKRNQLFRHLLIGASTNLMRKVLPYSSCLMVYDPPYSDGLSEQRTNTALLRRATLRRQEIACPSSPTHPAAILKRKPLPQGVS